MYSVRQIQRCDQNDLWTSSFNQEGFLQDDKIYFCPFLSYREVQYINLYVLGKINLMVWSKLLMDIIFGGRKILIVFVLPYKIHSLTDWQRVSFYKEYGPAGHNLINIWSMDGTVGLLSTLRTLYRTMRVSSYKEYGPAGHHSIQHMIHGWSNWTSVNLEDPL